MEVMDPTYRTKEVKDLTHRQEGEESENSKESKSIVIKVGMIGEKHTGKRSLMVKYVDDRFDEAYINTLGVNFIEKTVKLKNIAVTLSVWDLGGEDEYRQLMPLVCNDAKVILFIFDLTRKQTLLMIREWFRNAKKQNKYAIPFLIGAKFDRFNEKDMKFKKEVTKKAQKFAKNMKAPLIFCSASHSINIKKIFQIIIARVFHLTPKLPEVTKVGEPIVEYKASWTRWSKKKHETKMSSGRRVGKDRVREKKHPE